MKAIVTSLCAAALMAGCATDDGRYTSQSDIYREQWSGRPLRINPDQERWIDSRRFQRSITAREPEQVELTRTQEAMAMRRRAIRNREAANDFERWALNQGDTQIPIPSGTVSQSFRREEQLTALARPTLPMEPGDPALLPVAERLTRNQPTATAVPGRPGYVYSPFTSGAGYVDVSGLPPGSQARDPYTGRVFTVP